MLQKAKASTVLDVHSYKRPVVTSCGIPIFIIMVCGCFVSSLIFHDIVDMQYIIVFIAAPIVMMLVGIVDDFAKCHSKNIFQSDKQTLCVEILLVFVTLMIISIFYHSNTQSILQIAIYSIIIVGSANAFNISDGVDHGICNIAIPVTLGLLYIAYIKHNYDLCAVLSCLLLSLAGFYILNCKPALCFLGDSGSLFIGSLLAYTSIVLEVKYYFAFMAVLPLINITAVFSQRIVYAITRKNIRIFPFTPLHHYLEYLGYSEKQVADIILAISCTLTFAVCSIVFLANQ